jgi:hypothetical protein
LAPPAATFKTWVEIWLTHILEVAHRAVAAMPTDEKLLPIPKSFFNLKAIVQVTNALAHLDQQTRLGQRWPADFVRFFIPGSYSSLD